jgi:transcriptional regulator with XRE-family HTH domain
MRLYDNRLLEYIQSKGITQTSLAYDCGVSLAYIGKICRKQIVPSETILGKIKTFLIERNGLTEEDIRYILPSRNQAK